MKYTCPCCGYKTLEKPDCFDICPICFWEDDNIQRENPDYEGGANTISLRQAQKNYQEFGAMERRFLTYVRRPSGEDEKDSEWRPLEG